MKELQMWTDRMNINLDVLMLDELAIASAGEGLLVVSTLSYNQIYCAYACVCPSSLPYFRQAGLIEFN